MDAHKIREAVHVALSVHAPATSVKKREATAKFVADQLIEDGQRPIMLQAGDSDIAREAAVFATRQGRPDISRRLYELADRIHGTYSGRQ